MDRRERFSSLNDALLVALQGWQSDIWTAMPGIIQSYDPTENTCVVQVAIRARVKSPIDGSVSWEQLPLLVDCPVVFPSGGGLTLTFPLTNGNECLMVFASRCIDAWWQSGGVQNQADLRLHDLSDGFVIPGVKSKPNVIPNISTTSAQLRTDDGQTYLDIKSGTITIEAPTAVNVNTGTATVTASGNVNVTAGGTAVVKAASIALQNAGTALLKLLNSAFATWATSHVHSNGNGGADTGTPTTSPPASSQTSVVSAE